MYSAMTRAERGEREYRYFFSDQIFFLNNNNNNYGLWLVQQYLC